MLWYSDYAFSTGLLNGKADPTKGPLKFVPVLRIIAHVIVAFSFTGNAVFLLFTAAGTRAH